MNSLSFYTLLITLLIGIISPSKSRANDQLNYTGKIGRTLDVFFHLENNKSEITGFYYYKKPGIDIPLTGHLLNQKIVLYELDYKNDTIAVLIGTVKGSSITGTWRSVTSKKSYVLNLKETAETITPLPNSIAGIYVDSTCNLHLTVSKIKDAYYYDYISPKRTLKGKIGFSRGHDIYMVLEGIQFAEDFFDVALPDDSKLTKEYEQMAAEGNRRMGIDGQLSADEIIIQNYGNAMNYYVKLFECDEKYLHLLKQE